MSQTPWILPLLFTTGLAAGFVDSIAGGGGLLTVPILLATGLPAQDALGTNKLQASFGSGSAAWHFTRAGQVHPLQLLPGIIATFIGAIAGTMAARRLDPALLRQIIPWLLLSLGLYTLLQPRVGQAPGVQRMQPNPFHLLFGLALGFYDGFLGPGTGSFWAMAYVLVLGTDLAQATARTKIMNFTSNLVSLAVFAAGGHVHAAEGLTMGAGQWIGARIGAGLVLKRGARFVRPILIAMAFAVTLRLLWK